MYFNNSFRIQIIFKQIYMTQKSVKVGLGVIATKGFSTLHRSLEIEGRPYFSHAK